MGFPSPDARAFRALRFDAARADPAQTVAPPYDVISPGEQRALYDRSPHNIVRIEYGEQRPSDSERENRYTRAAADIAAWRRDGVLVRDAAPALYRYRQWFVSEGVEHVRDAVFAAVRLEEWERGVIKPHEHTLASPKADRLQLLRATHTQVSPVYGLYRPRGEDRSELIWSYEGSPLYDAGADGQRHMLSAVTDPAGCDAWSRFIARCDLYIADGHHRYETALAYRDEVRAQATHWSGEEPENFVLMALTYAYDPGLLVLPTHRLLHVPDVNDDERERISRFFRMEDLSSATLDEAQAMLAGEGARFIALGLRPQAKHLLVLDGRAPVEALMPAGESPAWKQLDVNVLQYGILQAAFGIDGAALMRGQAVTYTQDARAAAAAVERGDARVALLLNATPVDQVLAVADAGGRMPQKSTYFYPKLPTGLVMNALSG
ncbi:MAG: DUF1015 domain-containing protein [Dehalococcoidia bacterium]|nr:DUF1015 domain-containing protein [Dehalococcoidia bacterium]